MKKRRLLAWLMTLVMMVGLMPATALAAEAPLENLQSGVTKSIENVADLKKEVTGNKDGTYTVNLSVKAKQPVKTQPLEIVFVIDSSASMNQCTLDDATANAQGHNHTGAQCDKVGQTIGGTKIRSRMEVVQEKVCNLINTVAAKDSTAKVAIVTFDQNGEIINPNNNNKYFVELNEDGVTKLTSTSNTDKGYV